MARPTTLTYQMIEQIVQAVRSGNKPVDAAKAYGVAKSTYFDWAKRGREAEPDESGSYGDLTIFRELWQRLDDAQAESKAEVINLARLLMIGQNITETITTTERRRDGTEVTKTIVRERMIQDPPMIRWWLEKTYPDEYGAPQRVELSGPGGGPIELEAGQTTEDRRRELIARGLRVVGALPDDEDDTLDVEALDEPPALAAGE